MVILFLVIISTFICLIPSLFVVKKYGLPPGPPSIPLLGNIFWFSPCFSFLSAALRHLRSKYGPIVTLYVGSTPALFIMTGDLAHRTLVRMSQTFALRPPPLGTFRSLSANHHTINLATYNSEWRFLRHNISSFLATTTSSFSFSVVLRQSLDKIFNQFNHQAESKENVIMPSEIIQFTLFQFFSYLCFGEELDTELLREFRAVQLGILDLALKLSVFNLLPKVLMLAFFPRLWKLLSLRNRQEELIFPIIRMRRQSCQKENYRVKNSYLDSLLALRVKESGRTLTDQEILNLCSEFVNAATKTTSTALDWIMANLVMHEDVQGKLLDSLRYFSNEGDQHVKVESLKDIPYLRAVVLEGLRKHPPAQILLPHTVDRDISLDGYIIPKGAVINYSVAEIGRDKKVWEEPLSFIPERFLNEYDKVNMNVSKEIKMMPFGAGRRACPGEGVAMLVLEYFVANFVRRFHWKKVQGEDIDLTELQGLIVSMKHPFRTCLVSRAD